MDIIKPQISIITVVFNGVDRIENTILSIVNQTYNNIEYLIFDGGSTDGTVDIIKKYESKISYWISEPDKGIYDAMNKGIEKASGKWINFMNAGDTFCKNETISNIFIDENSSYNIIYGDCMTYNNYLNSEIKVKARNFSLIKFELPFCHQSVFVERQLLKENKFNLAYKNAADYDFFLKMHFHKLANPLYIELVVSNYENNGASNSYKTLKEYYIIHSKYYSLNKNHLYHLLRYQYFKSVFYLKKIVPNIIYKSIIILKYYIKIKLSSNHTLKQYK